MDKSANQHYNEIESEIENEDGESDVESILSDDQNDPTFDIVDETRSAFKALSIKKKSKAHDVRNEDIEDDSVNVDELEIDEKDKKSFEIVQNIIKAGQLVKLKIEQCKVYLRKYGLRLTGNKDTLMQRIKEHLEVLDGGGEKRYPVSSFVVNCKGDACTGDIVMFEQNVYDMFNIASRSATGPPCGTRTVAGRIVKESYGAVKQQHTFTIEVLWSKGEKPHPPLHPLLIKGRNLYRLKTLRQKWENEGDRQKALMEKHTRGYLARNDRENRMQEKEIRKNIRTARPLTKKEPNKNPTNQEPNKQQTRINSGYANHSVNPLMQPQQLRPFQIRQNSIPPFHQPAPVMTTTWNPTREEANVVLPQASTNPYRSGAAETMPQQANVMLPQASTNPYRSGAAETMPQQANVMLPQASTNPYRTGDATYTQKIQHQQTKIRHHGSYRQPLTSMNHHFSSSMNMNDRAPNYLPRTYNNSYYSTHERPTQNQMQRQHCRYFAKGRCYHGDNCKFLHEIVQ